MNKDQNSEKEGKLRLFELLFSVRFVTERRLFLFETINFSKCAQVDCYFFNKYFACHCSARSNTKENQLCFASVS